MSKPPRWASVLLVALCAGCTQAPQPAAPSSTASRPASVSTSLGPSSSPAASSAAPTPRSSPTAAGIPPVSAAAHAAGLVDVRTVVPDAILDLRYATSHNFVGVPLYPANARCLVHESMAPGLRTAAARLRRRGLLLVFWDCYRPHSVQVRMFQIVPNPDWVARPGPYARSHEAGRSVDVTLAGAACAAGRRDHCLLDMGTGFDDFSSRAHAFASTGVSAAARANRAILRAAMNAGGLAVYSGEWWHFDGPGAFTSRPFLNAPVN